MYDNLEFYNCDQDDEDDEDVSKLNIRLKSNDSLSDSSQNTNISKHSINFIDEQS